MTSTIKVNNIQNQCGANIANKCGSTITLGASGDTITLACGASQTGFGRTGTVDWDTTAKTASFTAVSGNGYFVNTTSGAITLTLPASPSAGDIVAFKDYAFTFATNSLTVDGNDSPIGGVDGTTPITYNTNGTSKTFIYVDGTKGWLVTNESTDTSQESNATFIVATGGTITCCGDYKIHTFTSPGTFTVCSVGNACGSNSVDYVVVAGGAAGGRGASNSGNSGAGGGAGGFREGYNPGSYCASPLATTALPVSATSYPITIGAGGSAPPFPATSCTATPSAGGNGSNSIFSTITSTGGGGGGNRSEPVTGNADGAPGGSGGGGAGGRPGGTGNTPPVSPSQGFPGGNAGGDVSGGGGGATVAATNAPPNTATAGGAGATTSISGTPTAYAGGGGGGQSTNNGANGGPPTGAAGGIGGGGKGSDDDTSNAVAGTTNTGGGGGGGGGSNPGTGSANGGSGIVIIRYKYQ
jgi:hypothetical protein